MDKLKFSGLFLKEGDLLGMELCFFREAIISCLQGVVIVYLTFENTVQSFDLSGDNGGVFFDFVVVILKFLDVGFQLPDNGA
jgi:hypothetical protein